MKFLALAVQKLKLEQTDWQTDTHTHTHKHTDPTEIITYQNTRMVTIYINIQNSRFWTTFFYLYQIYNLYWKFDWIKYNRKA